MERPIFLNYERKNITCSDDIDDAMWEYSEAQDKYIDYIESKLKNHGDIGHVSEWYHCQREEEEESKCETQCEHCKEYYKDTDNGR